MKLIGVELVNGKVVYRMHFGDTARYAFVIEDTEKNLCYGTNNVTLVSHILNKIETKLA